MSFLKIV